MSGLVFGLVLRGKVEVPGNEVVEKSRRYRSTSSYKRKPEERETGEERREGRGSANGSNRDVGIIKI